MFQILIVGIIIILSGLISIGVYSIVKDRENVVAYIMLGICGICILFIFGMIICIVSCYPSPGVVSVVVSPSASALHSGETFRGSNPLSPASPASLVSLAPLPAPRITVPPSASATARVPVITETFNGSNPMHP